MRLSEIDNGELIARARAMFGLTRNPDECGYILPDGSMLDLSGRHYSGDYIRDGDGWKIKNGSDWLAGSRNVDHRELSHEDEDLTLQGGTDGMLDFMRQSGAMRWMKGIGFGCCTMPTAKQIAVVIAAWPSVEPLHVDVTTDDGRDHSEYVKANPRAIVAYLKSVLAI